MGGDHRGLKATFGPRLVGDAWIRAFALCEGLVRFGISFQLGDVVQDDAGAVGFHAETAQCGECAGEIFLPAAKAGCQQSLIKW